MTDIVERLRYYVGNPSAWGHYDEGVSEKLGEAADEIERLTAERANRYWEGRYRDEAKDNERLRALVKDLADDVESEVNGHYPPEVRAYPSEQRRYERDMANVYEARRALEPKP